MTDSKNKKVAVFGLFKTEAMLERSVSTLTASGFASSDISALLPDVRSTKAFAHEKHTKAPEGAAVGAATGVVAGGTLGLLLGIGALAIPGLGPFIAAGPIMAALAGAGAGGAVGTLSGALVGMGIPEYEAKRYEAMLAGGGALLSVHCNNSEEEKRAKQILSSMGATGIDQEKEVAGKKASA